jgi:hypothetical protein
MYEHILQDQVDALIKAGLLPKNQKRKAVGILRKKCWTDQIAVVWTTDDVKSVAEQQGKKIGDAEAQEVLDEALHRFDASIGLNWDVLGEYLPDGLEDEDDDEK